MKDQAAAIVLAAGKSKRMQSDLPKVLHLLAGRPLLLHVVDALLEAEVKPIVVIVGYQADRVRTAVAGIAGVEFAVQREQLGTGHAVLSARETLQSHCGPIAILAGDQPLLRGQTIRRLLDALVSTGAACVVGSCIVENPEGLGRIVRDEQGEFARIVEQKDTGPKEAAIHEVNVSCYAFDGPRLWQALDEIRPDNAQKEWYLTDCVEILRRQGHRVSALPVVSEVEAMGVNTPEQLAAIEQVARGNARQP